MDESLLPKVEFEGPSTGQFWPLDSVPMEAIVRGIKDLFTELKNRNYKEEAIVELLKSLHP